MTSQMDRESAVAAMEQINRAWRDCRPADLQALFHPELTMALPGFVGRVEGRQTLLAGFEDFCTHATVEDYHESNLQADVIGNTAVVTFNYQMVYNRSGERYKATGRDLWVFARQEGSWLAVWRTMLDLQEQPA
jgi:ketosteroid isomerase-like protein